ncbi:winged helix-turn-helix domain-containing protein [Marinactinospora rubrisoli]|uniref:Winged helix-turn-helix domain-containing protein n=1 Tax=Marinactinospora rubrisoli TaxID=2715399 RepID=A0ABW2KIC5_9ACTN
MDSHDDFAVLTDPVCQKILAILDKNGETSFDGIAAELGSPDAGGLYTRLHLLREHGLVSCREEGGTTCFSISYEGPARQVVSFLTELLHTSLGDLGHAARSVTGGQVRRLHRDGRLEGEGRTA